MGKGQIKTFKRVTSTFPLHKPKEKGKQMEVRMGEWEEQSLAALHHLLSAASVSGPVLGKGWHEVGGRKNVRKLGPNAGSFIVHFLA